MSVLDGLVQPDARTCGAACLVAVDALGDPALAAALRSDPARWRAEVLATHAAVTGLVDLGRPGLPWPRALGTPPWAVSRRLAARQGRDWDARPVLPWRRAQVLADLRGLLAQGEVVPLFVGSATLPRHVVLLLDVRPGELGVYDPAQGRVVGVADETFTGAGLRLSGWDVPWASVTPRGPRSPA